MMPTNISNILLPIYHIKFGIVHTILIHLTQIRFNLFFQYAATLALDINLQAIEKIQSPLYKQYHKIKKLFSLNEKDISIFYTTLCETNITKNFLPIK